MKFHQFYISHTVETFQNVPESSPLYKSKIGKAIIEVCYRIKKNRAVETAFSELN
jgi:hypothetical protein